MLLLLHALRIVLRADKTIVDISCATAPDWRLDGWSITHLWLLTAACPTRRRVVVASEGSRIPRSIARICC